MVGLIVLATVRRDVRRCCLWPVGLATASGLMDAGLKALFARPRPAHPLLLETSYGFPSGHAMVALCLLGFLCFLAATAGTRLRPLGWILSALVLLAGCSRVYVGVHYPADVLAGYLAGVPLLSLAILTYRREPAPPGSGPFVQLGDQLAPALDGTLDAPQRHLHLDVSRRRAH
jgi:undecaprenyl-diphosphatase